MGTRRYRLHAAPLDGGDDVPRLLRALADRPGLMALDSAAGAPRRWSLVAFDPLPAARAPASIADLRALLATLETEAPPAGPELPFEGGFVGALSYDLGVTGEALDLPPPAWPGPPVVGGLYVDYVLVEHGNGEGDSRAWLVLGEPLGHDDPQRAAPPAARRAALEAELAAPRVLAPVRARGPLVRRVPAAEHIARIRAVQACIGRGELYQANLAHRFERDVDGHSVELFLRLREVNPAPYMGYARWGAGADGGALLSASPELLLELTGAGPERVARTRPIKGTAPRGVTPEEDAAHITALLASGKDRAELAMIVDLERNDLGRIAVAGSVAVRGFPTVETYASVHHLVADVVARPRAEVDAWEVLESLFPGGSITGAPKLASMEAIAALEGEGRGFFTGSLGCVDVRGRAAWSILIRTAEWRPARTGGHETAGVIGFHVGGGITWRSDPEAEERETCVKGAALAAAFAAVDQPVDTLGAVVRSMNAQGGLEGGNGPREDPGTAVAPPLPGR